MIEAIENKDKGTIIHVKIKIGKRCRFPSGYDSWKKRIEIEIDKEPIRGRANRKLLEILSKFFGVERREIEIVYGEKSREKGILIKRDKEYIINKLKDELRRIS